MLRRLCTPLSAWVLEIPKVASGTTCHALLIRATPHGRTLSSPADRSGEEGAARGGGPGRLVESVVERLVDRLSRGEFAPGAGPLPPLSSSAGGSAGSAGEGGGGSGRGGAVSYDFDIVPRPIDIEAFRRALAAALTEHAGAVGGAGGAGSGGGAAAWELQAAAPAQRLPESELSQLLAEEPVPVVRSRLAGLLSRSGF
ncbi:hypothetical protein TSOC_011343 [Tetrabaena socialis]|uniref:Uncharacterized protein n=1 Tax=Tetrabaena socialis TaxID=47790 RepID=A0A2J7ZQY7_9CHLO|nr:hypothetical protein TSOC_011343 [Tetrabaena socialis]|eukprot:PNH02670.1 hypothetical protein TSOC_011343 [Tetrabaena socialis]